jgi:hypothetical protein
MKTDKVIETEFNPVYPIYYEIFDTEKKKAFSKVFYFGNGTEIEEAKGKITGLVIKENKSEYIVFTSGEEVRIDRIISINGIPGPAYDEYDAFSLACLDCNVPGD